MPQKVFIEPAWKLPLSYGYMIDFPPDGYEFATAQHLEENLSRSLSRWTLSYDVLQFAGKVIPPVLVKSWLQRFRKPPAGTAVTYAHGHLVFRPEPWVVEIEYASLLLGSTPGLLKRFRSVVERSLASPYCRGIRLWCEAGRKAFFSQLNCQQFERKIYVVPVAVPPKQFVKGYDSAKVKLLVVGSGNIKGGGAAEKEALEALQAFGHLRQQYNNLELILKSEVPEYIKTRYGHMENIRIIDQIVPWKTLEQYFQSADIYIQLPRSTSPYRILEAMSYELPIVGVNSWANPEYIQEGKTGLLVNPSRRLLYSDGAAQKDFDTPEFFRPTKEPDPTVVAQLVGKLSLLIDNPELRRQLGQAGRWEVESGKFSIAARNHGLKKMFDEAIAGYEKWVARAKYEPGGTGELPRQRSEE